MASHKIWTFLGRLTFSVFLSHATVIVFMLNVVHDHFPINNYATVTAI